jgi:hypothetical protein
MKKVMKKTLVAALLTVSLASLSACSDGSDAPTTPTPKPSASATADTPDAPPAASVANADKQQAKVKEDVENFYATMQAEGEKFGSSAESRSTKPDYKALRGFFSGTLNNVKQDSYTAEENMLLSFVFSSAALPRANQAPKVPVWTITDPAKIVIDGDTATVPSSAFGQAATKSDEVDTLTLVDGRWLYNGAKYDDGYFADKGINIKELSK